MIRNPIPTPIARTARAARFATATAAVLALGACMSPRPMATAEPAGAPRVEIVWAVTDAGELIRVNAGQPQRILERRALQGLAAGESLVGIDFRAKTGVLYGLASSGRLLTIDTATGAAKPVGSAAPAPLAGTRFGMDFNPVPDRIRVVSDTGLNLRLHPETGAVAATDPALAYAAGDAGAGASRAPGVTAAAYTYNKVDDKITTNYAIDTTAGTLVMQGSKEGTVPAVSPNTGTLRTVGSLGVAGVEDASFDISVETDEAIAALRSGGRTRLYVVDLASGKATLLGTVGDGRALRGIAILP